MYFEMKRLHFKKLINIHTCNKFKKQILQEIFKFLFKEQVFEDLSSFTEVSNMMLEVSHVYYMQNKSGLCSKAKDV